jgi:hypothetical protein
MIGLPFLLATSLMLFLRHNYLIRIPKVREDQALFVGLGNLVLQLSAAKHRARAMMPSYHLTSASTQRNPQPDGVLLATHKRPEFV